MGQIIDETGVGETGLGEMGVILFFILALSKDFGYSKDEHRFLRIPTITF